MRLVVVAAPEAPGPCGRPPRYWADAKAHLTRARTWIASAKAAKPGGGLAAVVWAEVAWPERVALEVLLSEAEGLIEKP